MSIDIDLAQLNQSDIITPLWWEEVRNARLNHVTFHGWASEQKPDPLKEFPGIELLGSAVFREGGAGTWLFYLDNCLLQLSRNGDGSGPFVNINVHIASSDAEAVQKLEAKLRLLWPEIEQPEDENVHLRFWFQAPNGQGQAYTRRLAVPTWEEITDNYGQVVKEEVSRLVDEKFRPSHGGQLVLWQGPPGTGKTFAIRALIKEWQKWCDASYIIDPDAFFTNANYLMQVMLAGSQPNSFMENDEKRWTLVILEDSGELLSQDAKIRTGQALSRLLNIADGLIGQGLNVLILITTNEEMDSLHEAVSRPGRCASKVVFPKLSVEESNVWLEKQGLEFRTDKPMSLAELYGKQEGFAKEAEPEKPYQREMGFNAPKKPSRRAIGFDTGRGVMPAPSPIGPPAETEEELDGSKPVPVGS